MTHAYTDIQEFKERIRLADIEFPEFDDDADMLEQILGASEFVDELTGRAFHVLEETRIFGGDGSESLVIDDLVAVDTLKTDDNYDGVWETSWTTEDVASQGQYMLLPADAAPTNSYKSQSKPYTRLQVHPTGTSIRENAFRFREVWPEFPRAIQLDGRWGYWEHLKTRSETVSGAHNASVTTLAVSDGTKLHPGMTLQIGTEQLFVEGKASSNLTVERGVNGTTAATIAGGATIKKYVYPRNIVQATVILAGRARRRGDTAYTSAVGEGGSMPMGVDPDVWQLLRRFRRDV